MSASGQNQGQEGQGSKEGHRQDRQSPTTFPARLPDHILEFLQDSSSRARVVPPEDAPQGADEANDPLDIVNETQLVQWAMTEPAQLLGAISLLRTERDLGRETAEFYDKLPDDAIWKARYESSKAKRSLLERQLRERKTHNDFLQSQLQRSQNEYDQLRTRQREGTPSTVGSLEGKRTPKLPDVDVLTDGKSVPTWEEWIHKIHDKLEVNHDHFATERAKIAYVCGRTAGHAASHLYARRRKDSKNPYTLVDEVLADLSRHFDDPDRRKNAVRDYHRLMQGTKTFHEFYSEFTRLASYLDNTEQTLLDDLERKIAPRLNAMWAGVNHTDMTLDQTRDYLIKLDNAQRSASERKQEALVDAQKKTASPREAYRSSKQVTFARRPLGRSRDTSPRYTPNPQRNEDALEARCFYCHEKGHQMAECPKKAGPTPYAPPVRRSAAVNNLDPSDDPNEYDRSSSSASDSEN